MTYIVRIVTDEAFKGLVTSFVGPFDTRAHAQVYASDVETYHDGKGVECYVETLHGVPEGYEC